MLYNGQSVVILEGNVEEAESLNMPAGCGNESIFYNQAVLKDLK